MVSQGLTEAALRRWEQNITINNNTPKDPPGDILRDPPGAFIRDDFQFLDNRRHILPIDRDLLMDGSNATDLYVRF